MKTTKRLGIWMDHSSAYLTELAEGNYTTTVLESEFTAEEKELSLDKGENLMHNKERKHLSSFYKKISQVIRNFEEVVLFGPTTAKNELSNLLKDDHLFEKIKVVVKDAGKMNEYQMHSFVGNYFQNAV